MKRVLSVLGLPQILIVLVALAGVALVTLGERGQPAQAATSPSNSRQSSFPRSHIGETVTELTNTGGAFDSETDDCPGSCGVLGGWGRDAWELNLTQASDVTVQVQDCCLLGDAYEILIDNDAAESGAAIDPNHDNDCSIFHGVPGLAPQGTTVRLAAGTYSIRIHDDGGQCTAGCPAGYTVNIAVNPPGGAPLPTCLARVDGLGPLTPTPTPTATPVLDHFTCYNAGATKGSVKFPGILNPPGISLVDQFGTSQVQVKKPKFLCAPTDKNGEDPTAPTHPEHLKVYQIKNPLKPVLPTNIKVVDQFNPTGIFVNAKKTSHILVPSVKSLTGPTPVPTPGAFVTDHFQCYKIAISKNTPKFVPVLGVSLGDQFGTMTVDVKKPAFLCNPVNKNGEDPTAPSHIDHLFCYKAKQVDAVKFVKLIGAFVNDQFGSETLDVKKPALLCVPALKNPPPPTPTPTATPTPTTPTPTPTAQGACGSATAPMCDGACNTLGTACVQVGGGCACASASGACGVMAGSPQCYGECPPSTPVCVDNGGSCVCAIP